MRGSYLLVIVAGLLLSWNFQVQTLHAEELTVDSAIEALADEDAGTRKKAEDFLRGKGDDAIPALKKASTDAADPEVRKRAAALLTIAKRGALSVKVIDQAGKPVAGTEFVIMVFKVEDGKNVYAYGDQVYMDNIKPLVELTRKTGDDGVVTTDELNQDDYTVLLKTTGDLPMQVSKQDASNKDGAKTIEWKIFRGSTMTLKIVDENDKPLADTAVFFPEAWGEFSEATVRSIADRKLAKRLETYTKDTCVKTAADGTASFKKLFNPASTLIVYHAGYARAQKTGYKLVDGQTNDLGTLKLVPLKNSTVKVTLVDKDKKPLKGMTVIIVENDQHATLNNYVEQKLLPKVLEWKFAHSAGPSDDNGVATATLPPGEYAFAVAHGDSSNLVWVSAVENGTELDCGTVVLP